VTRAIVREVPATIRGNREKRELVFMGTSIGACNP
jgi:hypothetical protein